MLGLSDFSYMKRERKPLFGPGIKRTNEEKLQIFKESMSSSYSLPKVNPEFRFLDLLIPAVLYAIGYGVFIFFLVKWEGGSSQVQGLAGGMAVLFGIAHAIVSRAFVMGHMTERITLIFFAAVFLLSGLAITESKGW